jgi:TRAP-type C4-dicarboxylate transport system permease small subunit
VSRNSTIQRDVTVEVVPSRLNPLIVHLIWVIGGLTLGASLALLGIKNWTPDWIEATGTWLGAVATVLTLLWAVRSFRSDQAEREISRRAEREKEVAEQIERERDQTKEASNVSIALKGGGRYGTSPDQKMTSVYV